MPARIIDGKAVSKAMREEFKEEIRRLKEERGIVPGLAVILVGDNPASQTYVRNKEKACKEVGIYSEVYRLPASTPEKEVLELVDKLNKDPKIHGFFVQLPLPDHISEKAIIHAIDPAKDVDGFHPVNTGNLLIGDDCFLPCTPNGIMELLKRSDVELKGKEAVVIGRSNIVGKPVAILLMRQNSTVTICHSRTRDLAFHTRRADVLVVATGRPGTVDGSMIKEGAVVIDVGINRTDDGLVGDVDFPSAVEVAGAITPVPGGVGPMTITMLLKNTIEAASR